MGHRGQSVGRLLAFFGSALALLSFVCVAERALVLAQATPPPAGTLTSVAGASDALRALGLDDDRALSAMLTATFDGTRELPFDLTPYRTDASARMRLVRTILPVLRRITESQIFRDAYARVRAERIAYEPPRARTRQVEADGAQERQRAEAERRRREREAAIPADPDVLVATRLREFLALTDAMPWRAQLRTDERGRRVFVDAALEQKPRDWKLCFRVGRGTLDPARSYIRRWLSELEGHPTPAPR